MNDDVTMVPDRVTGEARNRAKRVLAQSMAFQNMPLNDQKSIYLSLVQEYIDKERNKLGLSKSMATDSGKDMGYKGYDPGFGGDTGAFNDLVDSVDFPKFVADLLKGVFDANLKVMKQQTDSYIKLMKEASKSVGDFIKQVKDEESFLKLAETRREQYNVVVEDGKVALTTPDGEKVDTEDADVKRHIMDAKIQMAQEHRMALQQVLVMGVTRLVVGGGEVDAAVEFSVKAKRESGAHHDDKNINIVNTHMEYDPPLFGLFGGPSGTIDVSNTNIRINTSDKKTTDDLSATLKGKVNIKFKTDYFKLDQFATMYGQGGIGAVPPAPAASGPGAAPAVRK
jgi:hypothetical protein